MEAKTIFRTQGYCQDIAKQLQYRKHPIYLALRGKQDKTDRNRQRGG